jgi:hypothetical protein
LLLRVWSHSAVVSRPLRGTALATGRRFSRFAVHLTIGESPASHSTG